MENNHGAAIEAKDARGVLEHLYSGVFDSDMAGTALALGREQSEVDDIINGTGAIDEDLAMKIHALAQQREAS